MFLILASAGLAEIAKSFLFQFSYLSEQVWLEDKRLSVHSNLA